MCVFVGDAAESVVSVDVEVVESPCFGDRGRQWAQGRRAVQRAVGTMPVVEELEFTERVEEVRVVPDQGAVLEFAPAGLHPPFRDRAGSHRRVHAVGMIGIDGCG